MTIITRFAPSPTGPLHLGHAYSALLAETLAHASTGTFLLRIEDIDQARSRPEWETQIYDDLRWLGLEWSEPVMRQSDQMVRYSRSLDALWDLGVLYPCHCSRRDITEAASAPQEGVPLMGPDGVIYPGTCRALPRPARRPTDCALRLDLSRLGHALNGQFFETGAGPKGQTGMIRVTRDHMISHVGDIILARRDMGTSYHLSVVLDDANQGITDVVRGQDLFDATAIHVVLQTLLGLPTPRYHHHRLIRDETGKRLAKRDNARAISKYRAEGATPQDIRQKVGLT